MSEDKSNIGRAINADECSDYIRIGNYKNITVPSNLLGNERDRFIVFEVMRGSDAAVLKSEIMERAVGMFEQFDISLSQQGLSIDEYYKKNNTDEQGLIREFMKHSERQLKERKVLLHIAEIEGVFADESDYSSYLEQMSRLYPLSAEKIREMLTEKEKQRILEEIALRKTIDYIANHCGND